MDRVDKKVKGIAIFAFLIIFFFITPVSAQQPPPLVTPISTVTLPGNDQIVPGEADGDGIVPGEAENGELQQEIVALNSRVESLSNRTRLFTTLTTLTTLAALLIAFVLYRSFRASAARIATSNFTNQSHLRFESPQLRQQADTLTQLEDSISTLAQRLSTVSNVVQKLQQGNTTQQEHTQINKLIRYTQQVEQSNKEFQRATEDKLLNIEEVTHKFDRDLALIQRELTTVQQQVNSFSSTITAYRRQVQELHAQLERVQSRIREGQGAQSSNFVSSVVLPQREPGELDELMTVYQRYRGKEKYVSVRQLVEGLVDDQIVTTKDQALAFIDHLARTYPQVVRMGRERGKSGNYLTIILDGLEKGRNDG